MGPTLPAGASAKALLQGLEQRGVLVRHFDAPRLDDKLRITVGTPEQNERLLRGLREILA